MVNIGIELAASNLGMAFEYIVLLVAVLGGFVFFAKDFKLGVVLEFFLSGAVFMWSYGMGWDYVPALATMLSWFVVLTFTLYFIGKQQATTGGFI